MWDLNPEGDPRREGLLWILPSARRCPEELGWSWWMPVSCEDHLGAISLIRLAFLNAMQNAQ